MMELYKERLTLVHTRNRVEEYSQKLLRDQDTERIGYLLANPNSDSSSLSELYRRENVDLLIRNNEYDSVASHLALREDTPDEVLEHSSSADPLLRLSVALNPSTPESLMDEIVEDTPDF